MLCLSGFELYSRCMGDPVGWIWGKYHGYSLHVRCRSRVRLVGSCRIMLLQSLQAVPFAISTRNTQTKCIMGYAKMASTVLIKQVTHSRSHAVCQKSERQQHGFMARASTFSNSNCFVRRLS